MGTLRTSRVALLVSLLAASSCGGNPDQRKRDYVASGDRHAAAREYAAAIIDYRNAIQLDARFGEAHDKLAGAYLHAGDATGALRTATTAADLLPDNVEAQLRAAKLLLLAGRFARRQGSHLAGVATRPAKCRGSGGARQRAGRYARFRRSRGTARGSARIGRRSGRHQYKPRPGACDGWPPGRGRTGVPASRRRRSRQRRQSLGAGALLLLAGADCRS